MIVQLHQAPTYCYTGGKAFNPQQPTVVFIHGVLNDHSVWILQSRYFAHHGWNVLALDLPGHGRSGGLAPDSVEAAADLVIALLDGLGITRAALVGHSMGALIALEAAARAGARISHLALVGIAYPMRVSPALLEASRTAPLQALHMVNVFSRASLAPPPSALGPGTWVFGASLALGKRILAGNPHTNLFYTGFQACDRYANGLAAMQQVQCATLFALGTVDQMTPADAADTLIAQARNARTVLLPCGHHQMSEAPEALLAALTQFLPAHP